jgi:hypothetical protein
MYDCSRAFQIENLKVAQAKKQLKDSFPGMVFPACFLLDF